MNLKFYTQDEGKVAIEPEVLHDVGNLIVMPKQMNSAFQNSTFSQKIELLTRWHEYDKKIANPPKYLIEFANKHKKKKTWEEADIRGRKSDLAKLVYKNLKAGTKY